MQITLPSGRLFWKIDSSHRKKTSSSRVKTGSSDQDWVICFKIGSSDPRITKLICSFGSSLGYRVSHVIWVKFRTESPDHLSPGQAESPGQQKWPSFSSVNHQTKTCDRPWSRLVVGSTNKNIIHKTKCILVSVENPREITSKKNLIWNSVLSCLVFLYVCTHHCCTNPHR